MSDRPWWASDGPGEGGGVGGADGDDPQRGGDPGQQRHAHGDADDPPHRHRADAPTDVCQVCPICAMLRAVDDVRPELVEHLTEAARHLTLAAKAFVDAQATGFEGDEGLQRIDLDE